jgi:cystathionine beta-lyase
MSGFSLQYTFNYLDMYNFDRIIDRSNSNAIKYDARERIFGRNDVLPLWVADMDFEVAPEIAEAINKRAEHKVFGYTLRDSEYYKVTQNWIKKRYKWDVSEDHISFSPGVVSALAMALLAFTKPGDKVIVQSPVYFPFFSTIENNGRRVLNNQLVDKGDTYQMDFEKLETQIDNQTRMMFLCNPHNPVGKAWTPEELKKLSDIVEKHNIIVVSDEIHSDIIFSGHVHTPFASVSEYAAQNTITCLAPSKTFNLAGLSTSMVVIQNEQMLKTYNYMIESFHIGLTNPFGLTALKAAYTNGENWLEELLVYLEKNRDFVYEFVRHELQGIKAYKPEATFLMWLDFRDMNLTQTQTRQLLVHKAKLGFSEGAIFRDGGEGFQRLNFGMPRSLLEQAMYQLKKAL